MHTDFMQQWVGASTTATGQQTHVCCTVLPSTTPAGAGMYTNSQITAVMQELTSSAFGNPHSRNPSSSRSTQEVEGARQLVLKFFNADPEQYHVVFTK
jgi:selenocysteine lyase/cysteine desulfurase